MGDRHCLPVVAPVVVVAYHRRMVHWCQAYLEVAGIHLAEDSQRHSPYPEAAVAHTAEVYPS